MPGFRDYEYARSDRRRKPAEDDPDEDDDQEREDRRREPRPSRPGALAEAIQKVIRIK